MRRQLVELLAWVGGRYGKAPGLERIVRAVCPPGDFEQGRRFASPVIRVCFAPTQHDGRLECRLLCAATSRSFARFSSLCWFQGL